MIIDTDNYLTVRNFAIKHKVPRQYIYTMIAHNLIENVMIDAVGFVARSTKVDLEKFYAIRRIENKNRYASNRLSKKK